MRERKKERRSNCAPVMQAIYGGVFHLVKKIFKIILLNAFHNHYINYVNVLQSHNFKEKKNKKNQMFFLVKKRHFK